MNTNEANTSVENDVLHGDGHSKLTAEEIAKAMAHHKKHHHDDQPQGGKAKTGSGKKNMAMKSR